MAADDAHRPLEDRLRSSLTSAAATQDPAGDWDAVVARHRSTAGRGALDLAPVRRLPRHRLALAAAAVLAVVATAAVALAVRDGSDRSTDVTTGASSTTAAPTTTSTTRPDDPTTDPTLPTEASTSISFDLAWADLPDHGLLVRDGAAVRLLDDAGDELAAATVDGLAATNGPLVLVPGPNGEEAAVAITQHPTPAPAPAGCDQPRGYLLDTSASSATASTSVCQADGEGDPEAGPQEIWLTTGGETTVLTGPPPGLADPPGETAGHWRSAVPSPDGAWVLGQWSGECESPSAWFVPTNGGDPVPAEAGIPESFGLAWTTEGRALVAFPEGVCGPGIGEPGVYAVDPADGEATLLVATSADGPLVWSWTKGERTAPQLAPADRDAARHSVEQLLAELRSGDHAGAATYWSGYPEVAEDAPGLRVEALEAFADRFAWLLDGARPEYAVVASVGSTTADPVVTVTVDGADGGRRSAAFVVGGERPNQPRQVLRLPAEPPSTSVAEGSAVAPGATIEVEGLPVEGGARAYVDGVEVAVEIDPEAGSTRVTLPAVLDGEVVLTLSRATPEVSDANAWWFPVAGG